MSEIIDTGVETVTIDSNIFNLTKDYHKSNGSLFLGDQPGLFDSINKTQPRIWELYKKLKSLDWDENEFNYGECQTEFETGNQDDIDMMITTLAWQWEADSVAANCVAPLFAPFVSSSELWAAYSYVGQNEVLHAATYSEIVRNGFKDPDAVMARVLGSIEPVKRLKTVAEVFSEGKRIGAMITLGQIDRNSDQARDACMKMVYALLGLERIQFMSSFAITFAFGETGRFMPICKAVQKICNEEFSIHVEIGKAVIRNEMNTKVGRDSFERIKDFVTKMFIEITEAEINWTCNHLFANGRALVGCTSDMVVDYVLYSANDAFETSGIRNPFKIVNKNPIGYMDDWINVDSNQASPQEERTANYLLGGFISTSGDKVYDTDGL